MYTHNLAGMCRFAPNVGANCLQRRADCGKVVVGSNDVQLSTEYYQMNEWPGACMDGYIYIEGWIDECMETCSATCRKKYL